VRIAVILEAERDARCVEVGLCASEIVLPDREREMPEPDGLGLRLDGGRLRLEETDARSEVAHEGGPVVLPGLVPERKSEHVAVPRDRACAIADVERDMVESLQVKRCHIVKNYPMPRKKKSEELAELRSRLRSQTELYMDAEPLLPIARALQEAIDARLVGETGLAIDVDKAWDDAIRDVATQIISGRLETIDPERVLQLYAERVGDDELKETLGRWAQKRTQELEYRERRDELRKEAARSGSIELARLDPGTRLRLGMFDPAQVSRAYKDSSIPPSRTIELRLVEPARGGADVICDTTLPFSSVDTLPAHRRGYIGSTINDAERALLEPRLQLHAPLGYDFGAGPENTEQIIGFVEIDEGVILLQGLP
jgi:hypothetical protein